VDDIGIYDEEIEMDSRVRSANLLTVLFAPFGIGLPLIRSWNLEEVSYDWEFLGARWKRQTRSLPLVKEERCKETKSDDKDCI